MRFRDRLAALLAWSTLFAVVSTWALDALGAEPTLLILASQSGSSAAIWLWWDRRLWGSTRAGASEETAP